MSRREQVRVLALFLASRAWIAAVGWWSFDAIPSGPFLLQVSAPVDVLFGPRWDEAYYLRIAAHGYEPDIAAIAFFPAYPIVIAGVARLLGTTLFVAARVISNVAGAAACLLFARLCRRDMSAAATIRAVALLVFFPTGIYLSLGYTESFFLLLTVGVLLASRSRRWVLASILGYVAALCRANGLLLVIPIVLEYVAARRREGRSVLGLTLLAFPLVPAGIGTYFLHLYVKTGDLFAHSHIEKSHWDRSFAFAWTAFRHALELEDVPLWYRLLLVAYGILPWIAIVLGIGQRMRLSYTAYALASATLAVSLGYLDSTGRFILVVAPMFMALGGALCRRPLLFALVLVAFAALEGATTVLFLRGYWTV